MPASCKSSRHLSATGICESEFAVAVMVPFSDRRGRYAFASRVARESERELSRRPHLRRRSSRRGRRVAVWKRFNRLSNVGPIRDVPLYRPPKTFGVSRKTVVSRLPKSLSRVIRTERFTKYFCEPQTAIPVYPSLRFGRLPKSGIFNRVREPGSIDHRRRSKTQKRFVWSIYNALKGEYSLKV